MLNIFAITYNGFRDISKQSQKMVQGQQLDFKESLDDFGLNDWNVSLDMLIIFASIYD